MKFRKTFDKALEKAKIGFDDKGNKIKGYSPICYEEHATLDYFGMLIFTSSKNLVIKLEITEKYY